MHSTQIHNDDTRAFIKEINAFSKMLRDVMSEVGSLDRPRHQSSHYQCWTKQRTGLHNEAILLFPFQNFVPISKRQMSKYAQQFTNYNEKYV